MARFFFAKFELHGINIFFYSDVFSFGKNLNYALFRIIRGLNLKGVYCTHYINNRPGFLLGEINTLQHATRQCKFLSYVWRRRSSSDL